MSVVGVGLVPAEPRRVLARRELVAPQAFSGLRVRVNDNVQAAADFSALGAVAVQGLPGAQVEPDLRHRRLDAVEVVPARALANRYYTLAHELTGYAVFPKFQTIVL